jgi:hypothetical protein
VHAGLLPGFYPILLLQHLREVVNQILFHVRLQFSRYLFNRLDFC